MSPLSKRSKLITIPEFADSRGILNLVESKVSIPFTIQSVSWLFNIKKDSCHHLNHYLDHDIFLLCLNGCFSVTVNRYPDQAKFVLYRTNMGLYIPCGNLAGVFGKTGNAVCLILHSEPQVNDYRYTDIYPTENRVSAYEMLHDR